jgi:asparagine synthetase B (glutamine-hydrolysing)
MFKYLGMFALAIWDKKIIAARDRLGLTFLLYAPKQ